MKRASGCPGGHSVLCAGYTRSEMLTSLEIIFPFMSLSNPLTISVAKFWSALLVPVRKYSSSAY